MLTVQKNVVHFTSYFYLSLALPTEMLRKAFSILKGHESKLYVAQRIVLVFSLYLLL